MSEIDDLYQEVILDHSRRPRNFRVVQGADAQANGYNALCGDRVTVFLVMDGEVIRDVAFQGTGCAISTASASMMTSALKGKTRTEARAFLESFHKMVTEGGDPESFPTDMTRLRSLAGVCEFPARVKCATLAWHTLEAALKGEEEAVSTE